MALSEIRTTNVYLMIKILFKFFYSAVFTATSHCTCFAVGPYTNPYPSQFLILEERLSPKSEMTQNLNTGTGDHGPECSTNKEPEDSPQTKVVPKLRCGRIELLELLDNDFPLISKTIEKTDLQSSIDRSLPTRIYRTFWEGDLLKDH